MQKADILSHAFPDLSDTQLKQFEQLKDSLLHWNQKINVVSRKDIDQLETRHILHSLAIARVCEFKPTTRILDVGTGGGFPGLPLAILFPETEFVLLDSIGKKIRVVEEHIQRCELQNVQTINARVESIKETYDFIVSRAVTAFPQFYRWTKSLVRGDSFNTIPNGILYLKGGDLSAELGSFGKRVRTEAISQWFNDPWFEQKQVVYLPVTGSPGK